MKIISFALPCLLVLAGCSTSSQPEAPKPPQIGMANPASVYCQQKGGTLIPVSTAQGAATIANYRAVKRLMNGHCGDGTIRLVKITAGCCTKITSYVASRPAPAHGSAWCFCCVEQGQRLFLAMSASRFPSCSCCASSARYCSRKVAKSTTSP